MKYVSIVLAMHVCLLLLTFLGVPFEYLKIAIYISSGVVLLAFGVISGIVRDAESKENKETSSSHEKIKEKEQEERNPAFTLKTSDTNEETPPVARPIADTAPFEADLYTLSSTISRPRSARDFEKMT